MQQKILHRSKIPRPVEVFSPRTTATNIEKNDFKLLTGIVLKLTKPTIVKLKRQFKSNHDQVDFITFAKLMGLELVGWQPNIPNRRYQMIRCLHKLFNQIDYLNKGVLSWEEMINYVAQKPLNTLNEKIPKNNLKTFSKVQMNKPKFENYIHKVVYVENLDKLAILEQNSNIIRFIDPGTGQIWSKFITIEPKKLIVNISSLKKTKGEYRKKQLELTSSVRVLDIIYISGKYQVILTSSSDKHIRGWKYNNNFSLSTDFTDQQFLFQKQFPQDIYSMEWDSINQILFCGSNKGKLFFYNIQLDLKNEMKVEEKQGHTDCISTMIVVPKLHFVVTGGMDGKVLLWDVQTYKLKEVYKQHTRSISCLCYHPDLILVFSAGYDTSICIWNPYTSNLIYKIVAHSTAITTMNILNNTNFLISVSSEGIMKVTELNKFKTIRSTSISIDEQYQLKPSHMAIIPNRLRLCIVGKGVEMFDYDKTYNPTNCDDSITISCKNSKKRFQFYTIASNKLKIWNALTGNIETIHEHQLDITAFIIDKYQKCYIIGDVKGNLSLCNMSNGYRLSILLKGQNNSPIYFLTSIVSDEDWVVIAVNEQNNIFIFKQTGNVLTLSKTIKISPHTNIKSIVHLIEHKLICVATDSEGMLLYEFDSVVKVEHYSLPEIVSVQQILKNVIQITFRSGEIKFYFSPPSTKLSTIYEFQHDEEMPVTFSLYCGGKNYVCDEKWEVTCYDYKSFIQAIQEEQYRFETVTITSLWTVKVATESIQQMVLMPEWDLFVTCCEDREVKLWSMDSGKYIDSLKQDYHKPEPMILMKQPRKTIMELQNKYEEYDPYFYESYSTISNSNWNLFLNFKPKFEDEHKMYYKLLKQLNQHIEEQNIAKQNISHPSNLKRFEESKVKTNNLLMKSFHGANESKRQSLENNYRQHREPAKSTIVNSSIRNKSVNLSTSFPDVVMRSKQPLQSFQSLHQVRQFPGKMHKHEKNSFKIHFHKKLNAHERMLHNQSIQKLARTCLQGKRQQNESPSMYLYAQQAIAANRLKQAFQKTSSCSLYKSNELFKNIIVRKSSNKHRLSKTVNRVIQ